MVTTPKIIILIALAVLQAPGFGVLSAPSKCPNSPQVTGYSSWTSLKNDIELGNRGGIFTICPSSILNAADKPTGKNKWSWIFLNNASSGKGLTIQCGDNGSLEDNCTIQGSTHHFTMANNPGKIIIKGITFKGSKMSCIHGVGVKNPVDIIDCIFTRNTDTQKTNENAGTINLDSGSKSFTFINCQFVNNLHCSNDGKLINIEQELSATFIGCIFQGNVGKLYLVHAYPCQRRVSGFQKMQIYG
mmetsp:Transcript_21545/g.45552  ORF Transcript_21545/g.45552 Transcript_21545/m.45552 type:complete len:245 (+) Transcript_21545:1234-1968(+)